MFIVTWVSGLWSSPNVLQDIHKKDDDNLLPELENWKRTYTPETIGAIRNLSAQQQRINEMVSSLLKFQDLATVEGEITDHSRLIVKECRAEVRRSLIEILGGTFPDPLIKEIQRVVLRRIYLVVATTCAKPLNHQA